MLRKNNFINFTVKWLYSIIIEHLWKSRKMKNTKSKISPS